MAATRSAASAVQFTLASLGASDIDLSTGVFTIAGKTNKTLGAAHDGLTFDFRIDGPGAEWELGSGVYTHGTTTLARTTIEASSTGSKVTFTGAVTVALVPAGAAWEEHKAAINAMVLNVALDFGATGDGTTDDTAAFQAALDQINDSGKPGTLFVPAPDVSYRIYSITISPKVDITIVGERSRLRRVDDATQQPFYSFDKGRMFNIYGQASDPIDPWGRNARILFDGIIFDGNRDNQLLTDNVTEWSSLRDFSLQWFHAVHIQGEDTDPYRQPVWFRDCYFEMQTGDGISLFANASVRAERCRFWNCFRGGIVVVGGYIELIARDCISDDDLVTTIGLNSGLYFEYEPEGYVRSNIVNINGWVFHQGAINVVTHGDALDVSGQTVAPLLPEEKNDYILRGLRVMPENKSEQIKFYNSGEANFIISDSIFYGGRQDTDGTWNRRTMFDGRNFEVSDCVFIASNNGRPVGDAAPDLYCAVIIRDFNENTHGRQRIRFSGCRFLLDETCHASAPVYAIQTDFIGHSIRASTNWAAGMQPPYITFDGCTFGHLKYYPGRDQGVAPYVRKFDQFLEPTLGTMMAFIECSGDGINGFKIEQGQASYPGNYTFVGGTYTVEGWMFRLGMPVGQPAESLSLTFRDFLLDDRYNDLSNTEAGTTFWDDIDIYGHRTIMVVSDPTAAGPVSVTSRLLCDVLREDNLYNIRLEGTPVVASSLTITNVESTDAIEDNGSGDLVDAADGITVVGAIDYATGVISFSWPAGKEPDDIEHVIHTYQHSNSVPGFTGDVAVLKTDRTQMWRCTTGHPTAATWTSIDVLPIDLAADVTGDLPVSNLAGGTGATASTFWRGDGSWSTPAGSGDVSKVGTPADNQIGIWTGDGTIEGDPDVTFDGTKFTLGAQGHLFLAEVAAAVADVAGQGQLWVMSDAPNNLYFTDDAGNDRQITYAGGAFHDGFSDFVADEHVAHTSIVLTAGAGLTGLGDISASRTVDVGAGTGIVVNADDVAVSATLAAIHALTPTDGNFIVGDGATWVAENGATALASIGGLPLAGGTMTGALNAGGQVIQNHLLSVVTGVSGTLTTAAHTGNTIVTSGNVTVPTTTGFHCTVIAGGAHTITFNATTTAALAAGDVVSLVVQSATVIKAVRVQAANLLAFA